MLYFIIVVLKATHRWVFKVTLCRLIMHATTTHTLYTFITSVVFQENVANLDDKFSISLNILTLLLSFFIVEYFL